MKFSFDNDIFTCMQINGVATESPLDPLLAKMFVGQQEENWSWFSLVPFKLVRRWQLFAYHQQGAKRQTANRAYKPARSTRVSLWTGGKIGEMPFMDTLVKKTHPSGWQTSINLARQSDATRSSQVLKRGGICLSPRGTKRTWWSVLWAGPWKYAHRKTLKGELQNIRAITRKNGYPPGTTTSIIERTFDPKPRVEEP